MALPDTLPFEFGTCNIRNTPDMPPPQVLADMSTTFASHVDSCVFQEIDVEDHPLLQRTFPATTWWYNDGSPAIRGTTECPQVFRKDVWKPVDDRDLPSWLDPMGYRVLSKGLAHVNPTRVLTYSVMRAGGEQFQPVMFVGTHWANKAFKDLADPHHDWYLRTWMLQYEKTAEFIHDVLDLGWLSIVFGGDLNAMHVPKFSPQQQWAWPAATIDKVALIPAQNGNGFKVTGTDSVNLHSDHNLRTVSVDMLPAPALPRV